MGSLLAARKAGEKGSRIMMSGVDQGSETFSAKGWRGNMLGFGGRILAAATTGSAPHVTAADAGVRV